MMNRDITIGKIVGTFGHQGTLKLLPLTDFPDRFLKMEEVVLELNGKQHLYHILEAKYYRSRILIKFKEITDLNGAETLRGATIKISRDELTPLPEGNYYIFDIIGLKVYAPDGVFLGIVEDIIHTGSNDVYVVGNENKGPLLVPALKEVVKELDIKGGRMVVDYKGDSGKQ